MTRFNPIALIAVSTVAAVSHLPTVASYQPGSGGRVMWDINCDYDANDYRSVHGIPEVCGDICADDPTCTHWSWTNYNGGTCWLKYGKVSTKQAKWGVQCGYVSTRFPATPSPTTPCSSAAQSAPPPAPTPAPTTPPHAPAPAPTTTPSPSTPTSGMSASDTGDMLSRVNSYRAQNGLPALSIDNRLVTSSQLHSQDQADHCQMTHTGSNGSRMGDRIKAQGYDFSTAAENVAAGQKSVSEVMTSWWNSPEHRANILNKDITHAGFGKAVNNGCGNYATYWTQDFGRLK